MVDDVEAAILCGGRGERLKPLTDYFQKVMIPIGPKKLPLLAYIIALLRRHGITRATLLTGYRSDDIRHYFGDGSQHGVKLTYSEDPKDLKGSLNAVANALRNGTIRTPESLLVYYGDVLTNLNIGALLEVHKSKKADATLVLARGYALPVGTARVSDGLVESFQEKPTLDISVTTGCMVVGPRSMNLMTRLAGVRNTDLMSHFVPALISERGRVAAYYTDADWFDVGTVASFEKLNRELSRKPTLYSA